MAVPRHTDLPSAPGSAADDDPQWLFAALLGEPQPKSNPTTPAATPDRLPVEIVEHLSDPCCIVDGDHFAVANDAFCALVGLPRADLLLAGSFAAIIPDADHPQYRGPAIVAAEAGLFEADVLVRPLDSARRFVVVRPAAATPIGADAPLPAPIYLPDLRETNAPGDSLAALAEAARLLLSSDATATLGEIVAATGKALGADRVTLLLHEPGDSPAQTVVVIHQQWSAPGQAHTTEPIGTRHAYNRTLPRWDRLAEAGVEHGQVATLPLAVQGYFTERGIGSYLVAPVRCAIEMRGILLVESSAAKRTWSTAEAGTVASIAGGIGSAIQRESTEHVMRVTLDHYRQLVEEASDVIYTTDLDGRFTWANKAMMTLSGYDLDTLRTMYLWQVVAPEYDVLAQEEASHFRDGARGTLSYEIEGIAADGSRFALELSVRAGYDDGRLVRIHSIGRDVTKRRQADELFRAVASNARVGMYIVVDGLFEFVNPQFATLTGYTEAELLGRRATDIVVAGERSRVRKIVEAQVASGRGQPYEYEIVRKSGERCWVMESITPITYRGQRAALGNSVDITERKRTEAQLSRQAFEDALTGLPNRAAFLGALNAALKDGEPAEEVALLYIDLDGFKAVNDTLGHEAGDELLAFVAQRIRECVRTEALVARLGGDEFTVLLRNMENPREAEATAARIVSVLERPFLISEREVTIGASIGVAGSLPGQTSGRELLRAADSALYRAKAAGKNRFAHAADSKGHLVA